MVRSAALRLVEGLLASRLRSLDGRGATKLKPIFLRHETAPIPFPRESAPPLSVSVRDPNDGTQSTNTVTSRTNYWKRIRTVARRSSYRQGSTKSRAAVSNRKSSATTAVFKCCRSESASPRRILR